MQKHKSDRYEGLNGVDLNMAKELDAYLSDLGFIPVGRWVQVSGSSFSAPVRYGSSILEVYTTRMHGAAIYPSQESTAMMMYIHYNRGFEVEMVRIHEWLRSH